MNQPEDFGSAARSLLSALGPAEARKVAAVRDFAIEMLSRGYREAIVGVCAADPPMSAARGLVSGARMALGMKNTAAGAVFSGPTGEKLALLAAGVISHQREVRAEARNDPAAEAEPVRAMRP